MDSSQSSVKSIVSLIIIMASLFALVFLQTEERRQNYQILKLNRELKQTMELRQNFEVQRLKALRPQIIEKHIQTRTALSPADSHQIIHLPSLLGPPMDDRQKEGRHL